MVTADQIVVYGGAAHHEFAEKTLSLLNIRCGEWLKFTHIRYSIFPDGELGFYFTGEEKIRDRHMIIFSCPITPKLELELQHMVVAAKKQFLACTVTVVLPFLRYRRQDRREKMHEITRLRWFLYGLKQFGADNLILCEPHSVENTQRYADEFGLKLFIADPTRLFADAIRSSVQTAGGAQKFRIYAPDFGSVSRALRLGHALGINVFATPKKRGPDGKITTMSDTAEFLKQIREEFGDDVNVHCDIKEIRGLTLITREDEVDTGRTAVSTMQMLLSAGAADGWLVATHPVCSRGWKDVLYPHGETQTFSNVWLGNTRLRGEGETPYEGSTGRVHTVSMEPVIAEALFTAIYTLS